jgi:hypothetical protein
MRNLGALQLGELAAEALRAGWLGDPLTLEELLELEAAEGGEEWWKSEGISTVAPQIISPATTAMATHHQNFSWFPCREPPCCTMGW